MVVRRALSDAQRRLLAVYRRAESVGRATFYWQMRVLR